MPSNKSALNFGRAYLFYVHQPAGSYSFRVSVVVNHPLDSNTGMSVNLVEMDKICRGLFKSASLKRMNLIALLQKKTNKLAGELKKKNTKLISVDYFEKRGFGLSFKGSEFFFIRHDFALDKKGNLVEVTSHFDLHNKLKRVRLVHEKDQLIEQIIY